MHVKVHVLGSYTEKAKIAARGSLYSAHERTGSNLQYEPFLFSAACSKTELSISGKNWEIKENVIHRKSEIIDRGYRSCALESTGCKLQYEPYLFSVACS